MFLLYPNKPVETFSLEQYEKETGQWDCSSKVDGWRTLIIRDSKHIIASSYPNGNHAWARGSKKDLFFLSRRGLDKGGPTNIPVKDEIVQAVENLNLSDNSMLDGEWLERRTKDQIPECLFVLDLLWLNDEWQGTKIFQDRQKTLDNLLVKNEHLRVPDRVLSGYKDFFEKQRLNLWTEGVVLKHLKSTIISDRKECVKNPLWTKVKTRRGDDGRREVWLPHG